MDESIEKFKEKCGELSYKLLNEIKEHSGTEALISLPFVLGAVISMYDRKDQEKIVKNVKDILDKDLENNFKDQKGIWDENQ